MKIIAFKDLRVGDTVFQYNKQFDVINRVTCVYDDTIDHGDGRPVRPLKYLCFTDRFGKIPDEQHALYMIQNKVHDYPFFALWEHELSPDAFGNLLFTCGHSFAPDTDHPMQVTKEAFERIQQALKKELQSAQAKLKTNRGTIRNLSKEQRTLKSEIGRLYAMLRDMDGKKAKVSKKHRKDEQAPAKDS